MIRVEIIPILKDNYTYILIAPDGDCAIIDPAESAPVIAFLEQHNLTPSHIFNTHHHGDHVGGNAGLKDHFKCQIIGPAKEATKIGTLDIPLAAGDVFSFGGEDIHILRAEGHTAGGIMFHFPQSKFLFVGDTLFSMGCGRLFEGTAEQMFAALQIINALPDDTKIYCGHEYTLVNGAFCLSIEPDNSAIQNRIAEAQHLRAQNLPTLPTTVELEKETNVFLRATNVDDFAALREKRNNFK